VGSGEQAVYRKEILDYLYVMAGPAVFLFLLSLIYFPSRPPTPPSYTSAEERSAPSRRRISTS
jgi:hypothetical protein